MKKIVFIFCPSFNNENKLLVDKASKNPQTIFYPMLELKTKLENLGFQVLTRQQVELDRVDLAVFWDIDQTLYKEAKSLSQTIPCILVCTETPIYKPLSSRSYVVFNKCWKSVLTWNTGFQSPSVFHYDIPYVYDYFPDDIQDLRTDLEDIKNSKGVIISDSQNINKGIIAQRNILYLELEKQGYIDLYKDCLPKTKFQTIRNYSYSVFSENSIYPGYVTQSLADNVMAGIPTIYYGDFITAEKRFSACFVKLEDLSVASFLKAKHEVFDRYESLLTNIWNIRQQAHTWSSHFLEVFEKMICKLSFE